MYSTIIIIMNNLAPRNNTILLLTCAQPSFPYDKFDSGSLNVNLAEGAPSLAQSKAAALYGTVDL